MNKIQYIKLLELRGITELKGISIAQAVKESGGDPTLKEMVKVNEESMKYYIDKFIEVENKNIQLNKELASMALKIEKLTENELLLNYLQAAGIDNWSGYEIAINMMNEDNANTSL